MKKIIFAKSIFKYKAASLLNKSYIHLHKLYTALFEAIAHIT